MSTFLVTGSEGNIGPYLINQIRQTFPDAKIIRVAHKHTAKNRNKIDFVMRGDLNDKKFVDKIFQKHQIDFVIYAATPPYNQDGFKQPNKILKTEALCLNNVLTNCKKIKKIVYLSSVLVYESGNVTPFAEEMTDKIPPPKSPYGLAKHLGEKAVKLFASQNHISYTIWRAHNVVSPLEQVTATGHVYTDFYRKIFLEKTPVLEIYGSGRQTRCFTWVEDLAKGMIEFVNNAKTDNQIFNIGGAEPKTLLELKDELIKIGKEKKYLPEDYNPETKTGTRFYGADDPKRFSSVEKIKAVLGWECKTGFKTCFEKFIDYKQKHDND